MTHIIAVAILTMGVLFGLFALRLLVTSSILGDAANQLRAYCERELDSLNMPKIKRLWDRLDEKSFEAILWNPMIWTWRQAFPWLAELQRGQRPPKAPPTEDVQ